MKKIVVLVLIILSGCKEESKVSIEDLYFENIKYNFVDIYVLNNKIQGKDCNNKTIVSDNEISGCFSLIKTITKEEANNIYQLVTDTSNYGGTVYSCFTLDYSLVFRLDSDINGYIDISNECNYLNSRPIIIANYKKILHLLGFNNSAFGFSKSGGELINEEMKSLLR